MYSIGIDCGSVATKGILFDGSNIIKSHIIPTGWSPQGASREVLDRLLASIEPSELKAVVGTGYGRVSMDFVDKTVTEITCHTRGIHFLKPNIRTILDIGGQDSKVINLDEHGNINDFIMNDKCAAGTGRFLQVMVNLLGSDISKIDELAKDAKPQSISSMCTVFAESEVVSLLAQGASKESIAAGILQSICNKAGSLLDKLKIEGDLAFTGGLAASSVLTQMISKKTKREIYVSSQSQFVGALGASIIGMNLK